MRRHRGFAALVALAVAGCSQVAPQHKGVVIKTSGWTAHNVAVTDAQWGPSKAWTVSGEPTIRMAGVSGTEDIGIGMTGAVGSFQLQLDRGAGGYVVEAGTTYTVRTPVNVTDCPDPGGAGVWAELFFFALDGKQIKQVNGPTINQPCKPGQQTLSVSAKAPEAAVFLQPTVVMGSRTANDHLEFFAGAATLSVNR